MNLPAATLLAAILLPIVAAGLQKWGARDYDNRQPRAWGQQMDDPRRQRALAAQANSWEALAVFAPSLLFALHQGVDPLWVDRLCTLFIAARVVYLWAYVTDRAAFRSLVWFFGFGASLGLLGLGL